MIHADQDSRMPKAEASVSRRLNIGVFIDHDIIVRHFIRSGAFKSLMEKHRVLFAFPPDGYKNNGRVSVDVHGLGLGHRVRRVAVNDARLRIWSHLTHIDRLRWRPGSHWACIRKIVREAIGPGHVRDFTLRSLPIAYQWYRRASLRRLAALPNTHIDEFIRSEGIDIIIHPTVLYGPYIDDLAMASQDWRVPMIVMMNSWDNPCTKRIVSRPADWLLVWGRQSKTYAEDIYGMPTDRAIVFGAAQFEAYRKPPTLTRADFCKIHGLDPTRKLIVYAGSNIHADEFSHLVSLDNAIVDGSVPGVSIVYRPHPWGGLPPDTCARILAYPWKEVRLQNKTRSWLEDWVAGRSDIVYPDYQDSQDLLSNVDGLISPYSTMIIEAAMKGLAVATYMPVDDQGTYLDQLAPLTHFKEVLASPHFIHARGRDQLIPAARQLVDRMNDAGFPERMREASRFYVERFDQPYGERLTAFVESAVRGSPGGEREREVA